MNKLKYIFIYLIVIFFFGCKAKEKTIEITEKVKTDSVDRKLTLNTKSTVKVKTLCDSITGLPKDFIQITENGTARATTTVKDNQLTTTVETDSTKQETRIITETEYVYKDNVIVEYQTPKWCWYTLLVVLVFILFPVIPSTINSLARKLIGLF